MIPAQAASSGHTTATSYYSAIRMLLAVMSESVDLITYTAVNCSLRNRRAYYMRASHIKMLFALITPIHDSHTLLLMVALLSLLL